MDDKQYIENLEQALIFMCAWYQETYNAILKDYLDKRNDKFMKLPSIQGTSNRISVENIGKFEGKVKYGFSFKKIEEAMVEKYG